MKELIDYIIYEKSLKHINDRARVLLDRTLGILLLSNRYETCKYIKEINDKEVYWIISNHFGFISGQWQDSEFINLIKLKTEDFKGIVEDVYFERFLDNIKEAEDALDKENLT